MLRGSKIGRSLLGKSIQLQFTPTPKSPQAAGAKRRSCRHGPAVPKGGRRKAPRPPPGPGPATATCPHISPAAPTNNGPIAGRSQPSHRRRGRAQLSEHSADQCGALSAAPKEQDKAPHMVEDVLKAKPGPRRTVPPLLAEQLGDLDGVGCRALTDLVATAPEGDATRGLGVRDVAAHATDPN